MRTPPAWAYPEKPQFRGVVGELPALARTRFGLSPVGPGAYPAIRPRVGGTATRDAIYERLCEQAVLARARGDDLECSFQVCLMAFLPAPYIAYARATFASCFLTSAATVNSSCKRNLRRK